MPQGSPTAKRTGKAIRQREIWESKTQEAAMEISLIADAVSFILFISVVAVLVPDWWAEYKRLRRWK
jgi:hypothetical protein